jgi:putative AlgH/UPF0301 family transcriptional regulator
MINMNAQVAATYHDIKSDQDGIQGTKLCRICLEEEAQGDVLISPCNCKGTQEFVHKSCLIKWQEVAIAQANPRRAFACSVCKSVFSHKPNESFSTRSRTSPASTPSFVRRFFVALICLIAVLFSRLLPPSIHILTAFAAMYVASQYSRLGIADGDPVPGVMAGCYLIADRMPRSSIFHQSVILLLQHDRHGSLGVIINNPEGIGGPVHSSRPIFLTDTESRAVQEVPGVPGLFWGRSGRSASPHQPLESPAGGGDAAPGPRRKEFAGLSGWAPRQLDGEVRRGSWRLAAATAATALAAHRDAALWRGLMAEAPMAL